MIDGTEFTPVNIRCMFTFSVLPKFDVKVELPPYVLTSDKEMHGTVKAT